MYYSRTFVLLAALCFSTSIFGQASQPNILFIVVDDLNDYIGVLGGHPQIETPNIDALAEAGVLFTNAYCNAPLCAPSRTSFMSGKDLNYTQVYNNKQVEDFFRENFTADENNEEVISLPEHLKANGYYTFGINKVFHNSNYLDFDSITADPCLKSLSWSRVTNFEDFDWVKDEASPTLAGVDGYFWGKTSNDLEDDLKDYRAVDTAIAFINAVGSGEDNLCGDAFFLALGISRPHLDLFIPEHFYSDYYLDDFYATPFVKPYNEPANAYPPNGLVMPPQPDNIWGDYDSLGALGKYVAQSQKDLQISFEDWRSELLPIPLISDTLTDEERNFILEESKRANAIMAYMAAIEYVDAQIGRLMDALAANPALFNNTIIVFVSDNGLSLGEKRHWLKRSLWDTDTRVPVMVVRPGKPGNRVCNRVISLLDLYPTICDLAEIDYPTFTDGSDYLDGKSFLPLLNNVNKVWEAPALISWEAEPNKECSCSPQYAVRNERFHYIKYQSDNGTLGSNVCDPTTSIFEEEFYDVGVNRETDPYEWYNQINNPDYAPVIHYLQQFFPDSALYLTKPLTVDILNKPVPCFLNATAKIKLQTKLYSSTGALLTGATLGDYQFKWTNSLTGAVQFGPAVFFNMATVPALLFNTNDHILFYIEVFDAVSGKLVAFNTKTFAINATNLPTATFDLQLDDALNTATIIDYTITGSYKNTYWNFGDGFITEDFLPATHTYAANGMYNIVNFIEYGNGCQMAVHETADLSLRDAASNNNIIIYPNPATEQLNISFMQVHSAGEIQIMDALGRVVLIKPIGENEVLISLPISSLPQGIYFARFMSEAMVITQQFDKL